MDLFHEQYSSESKIYDGLDAIFSQEQFLGMRKILSKRQTEIDFGDKKFTVVLSLLFDEIEKLKNQSTTKKKKPNKKRKNTETDKAILVNARLWILSEVTQCRKDEPPPAAAAHEMYARLLCLKQGFSPKSNISLLLSIPKTARRADVKRRSSKTKNLAYAFSACSKILRVYRKTRKTKMRIIYGT